MLALFAFHFAHFLSHTRLLSSALLIAPMYFIPSSFTKKCCESSSISSTRNGNGNSNGIQPPIQLYYFFRINIKKIYSISNNADIAALNCIVPLQKNVLVCEVVWVQSFWREVVNNSNKSHGLNQFKMRIWNRNIK